MGASPGGCACHGCSFPVVFRAIRGLDVRCAPVGSRNRACKPSSLGIRYRRKWIALSGVRRGFTPEAPSLRRLGGSETGSKRFPPDTATDGYGPSLCDAT